MDRLTESNPSWIDDELWESACKPDCEEIDAVYRKLKEYEDLEESGDLLRPPCRLGDTVYGIFRQTKIIPLIITGITFNEFGITLSAKNEEELGYRTINLTEDGIGVEWYKTEEEAEAAINKLKGIDNKDIERD